MRVWARLQTRIACGAGLALAFCASAATAATSPAGDWLVAKGEAIIRVVDCGGQYWGLVAWEKNPGGTDAHNPNASLRNRTTLGMPILLGMRPAGQQAAWSGEIYNSEDGRTYSGKISLAGNNTLRVQGCVLGIFCGGEEWHRANGASALAQAPGHGAKGAGATAAIASQPTARICSGLVRRH